MQVAVLEEQTWQRLSKELRRRRGLTAEVDGHQADINFMSLANVAEKNSSWAKGRAYIAGLTLQSNLCTGSRAEVGEAKTSRISDPVSDLLSGQKSTFKTTVTSTTGMKSMKNYLDNI
jgi:hypothetical protein